MKTLLLCIISTLFIGVRLSEVNVFPKLGSELQLGDCVLIGGEPANVTDISTNDDGSLIITGKFVFSDEFSEKEVNPEETIDVSSLNFTHYKVVEVNKNNHLVLKDSDENERDDVEASDEQKEQIKGLLSEKNDVYVEVAQCFDVAKLLRILR